MVFGFSVPKLLLLAIMLVVVWQMFKLIDRRSAAKRRREIERAAEAVVERGVNKRRAAERSASVETVECSTCGSFVPRNGPAACERQDCPHPAA